MEEQVEATNPSSQNMPEQEREATNQSSQNMPKQETGTTTHDPNSQNQEKTEKDAMRYNILEQLDILDREKPPRKSIFQVPNKLSKFTKDSYSPRVVSIGPIHHGKNELIAMEELKWRYVNSFFCRVEEPGKAFDECVEEIIKVEENARRYYACDLNGLSKYQLAQILLVDGCFILELLLRNSNQLKLKYKDKGVGVINKKEDPILNNDLMIRMLQQDLALLENQIPFTVLETLFCCIDSNIQSLCITCNVLGFFSSILNFRGDVRINMCMEEEAANPINLHLLQIMHNYYLRPHLNIDLSASGEKKYKFEYCATQLYKGGVKFERALSDHLLDITFDKKKGVIRIPQLRVGGIASSLVRNLVAFEQCNLGTTHHMTAYAMLMGNLVSSTEDVELLKRKEILQLELGSGEDVLISFFRNISVELIPKDYYFDGLCRQVDKYRRSHWNWHRRRASAIVWCQETTAMMKRDYCPNPFKTMSVMAAFVLLLFTALQTFYSVRSYYPH